MSKKEKYLFTEEWDDGGRTHVKAYGKRKQKEIDSIIDQMERYSPYNYVDSVICDTEGEYRTYLQARIDNGAEVKYNNQ